MLELFRQKMPLSCLLYGLLERCFSAERLDGIFLDNAKEQYTREILFSTVCDLMLGVILKIHPSVNAAHQKHPEPLGITVSALYEKLKGVELTVSRAVGGNNQTLTQARQAWRDARAAALAALEVPIPEAVRLCGHKLLEEVWDQARADAGARFEADRRALAGERDQLAQDAREAAVLADRLAAELAQSVEDRRQSEENAALLAQKSMGLERQVAALAEEGGPTADRTGRGQLRSPGASGDRGGATPAAVGRRSVRRTPRGCESGIHARFALSVGAVSCLRRPRPSPLNSSRPSKGSEHRSQT
jgi:hypothetical protein